MEQLITQQKTVPPVEAQGKTKTSLHLPRPIDERLEFAAYKRDRSKTSIITEALINWLDQNQIPAAVEGRNG